MKKDNISKFDHCYGCGVCVSVCPVKIINFKEDRKGFYAPYITDQEKCINCGLCLKICAFNHESVSNEDKVELRAFAAHSNNDIIRQRCSSGGIGFEIGKIMIERGYKACGVRYNWGKRRAEHFIAETTEEFQPSIGSKYIPSYSSEAFSEIDRKERNFVVGTPCQIDSFRRMIQHYKVEDKFVLLDFFCHGVPSLLLWDKYLSEVEAKIGKATFVSWRNKTAGRQDSCAMYADVDSDSLDWHNSYNLMIRGEKKYQYRRTEGDLFYKFFLGNYCLNECCYKDCKYKMCNSAADIRIGDLWGKTYAGDNKGTSAVISFTKLGNDILSVLGNSSCTIIEKPFQTVSEGQMVHLPSKPCITNIIFRCLRSRHSLKWINTVIIVPYYTFFRLPKHLLIRIKRMMTKHLVK